MCVLSIKVPIRKKSGNLSYAPRTNIWMEYSCIHNLTSFSFELFIWSGFRSCPLINKQFITKRSWSYYYYYSLIRVFHISVSWWYFTEDWVTASLLKSPGVFSVFWPFSIMLLFGWSSLGRPLPNIPGPLITFSYRAKGTNHHWYNCLLQVP